MISMRIWTNVETVLDRNTSLSIKWHAEERPQQVFHVLRLLNVG